MNERITVIIKTFRRYNCLLQIVNSIRKFYPTVTIIIADDRKDSQKNSYFRLKLSSIFTSICPRFHLDFTSISPQAYLNRLHRIHARSEIIKSPDEDAKVSPEVNVIKEDKHIKYFKLPEDNGWNNGRALLISQGIFTNPRALRRPLNTF